MSNRGYFAIGVYHAKTETNIGTLWRSAHCFGAAMIFTVGRRYHKQASDTTAAWRHVPLMHFTTIEDLVEHLPVACPLVGVELSPNSTSLRGFIHPERTCYLFGAEDYGLTPEALAACHRIVEIPGGQYCLNVAVAGSIVMYDRTSKRSLPDGT